MDFLFFLFNLNLFLLGLDHFVTGGFALFSPKKAIESYKHIFGINIPISEEYLALMKPWGALGLFAGFIGLLPMYDPKQYIGVLYCFIILLICRIYIRVSNMKKAEEHFGLSRKRNLFHVGLISICAVIISLQILVLAQ